MIASQLVHGSRVLFITLQSGYECRCGVSTGVTPSEIRVAFFILVSTWTIFDSSVVRDERKYYTFFF